MGFQTNAEMLVGLIARSAARRHGGTPIRDMARTRRDPASGAYLGHTLRGEIQY